MTQTLHLVRLEQTDFATYGQLIDAENKAVAVTLERPWLNNQHDVSCIPAGTFTALRFPAGSGKRPYDVFKLTNVPGRSDIEIHIGNLPHDTEGCILLGSNFGPVNGQRGITGSAAAFSKFMTSMRGVDTFALVVLDPEPAATEAAA